MHVGEIHAVAQSEANVTIHELQRKSSSARKACSRGMTRRARRGRDNERSRRYTRPGSGLPQDS